MKPQLRRVHSPDCDDLSSFRPDNPGCFSLLVQLLIGPDIREGEESFDVILCTAPWIAAQVADVGVLNLRHHLVVDNWNWARIRSYVEGFLSDVEGESWPEVAAVVGRLGRWEFEDYSDG